jgi:hypothetical protein
MTTMILPDQIQSLIDAEVDRLSGSFAALRMTARTKGTRKKTMAAMKKAIAAMFCEFEVG